MIMKVIKELHSLNPEIFECSIPLTVERRVLAKRRWRGKAEDGTDFGFDLDVPLKLDRCWILTYGTDKRRISLGVFKQKARTHKCSRLLGWRIGDILRGVIERLLLWSGTCKV